MSPDIAIKRKILQKALGNAPFDGWNDTMLQSAAASAGLAKNEVYIYFPNGISGLVDFFAGENIEELQKIALHLDKNEKLPGKITRLIMEYLKAAKANREAIKKLSSYYAIPVNTVHGMKNLSRFVNALWELSGDKSVDFTYYTKRFTLAAIYGQTLLFWLGDESKDLADTGDFLGRKMAELMQFHKLKSGIKDYLKGSK